jgi:hypothetical protein
MKILPSVAGAATDGSNVRFAPVLFQPIAEDDATHIHPKSPGGNMTHPDRR